MPHIKLLPEALRNQIAAGEVVERPASVVKELVENSLDAGATFITVEVQDGGENFLRITDNGCGMDDADAMSAFDRHATSKITHTEDLWNILTLGFRGEAIASIASVAKVRLLTKEKGKIEGTLVEVEGGNIAKKETVGCPEGTQIEIKDLFYNVPVRKKYLKKSSTEYSQILETLSLLALGFPMVGFRLIHNHHVVFDLPASTDQLYRVESLLGKDLKRELVPVFCQHPHLQLAGYISKPSFHRASKKNQYLLVNQRGVVAPFLSYAVKQSYHSLLPKEKYPAFIFWLTIDPDLVDVNVHPRKLEVRFSDEKEVFQLILKSCQQALEKHVLSPELSLPKMQQITHEKQGNSKERSPLSSIKNWRVEDKENFSTLSVSSPPTFQEKHAQIFQKSSSPSFVESKAVSAQTIAAPLPSESLSQNEKPKLFALKEDIDTLIPLAQMDNSYLLCEQQTAQGKNLVILDQHAAHERIRYTEIMKEFDSKKISTQSLLIPLQLELSRQEIIILEANKELLQQLGVELESFGGNTFTLYAVPAVLAQEDLHSVILGILDDLDSNAEKGDLQARKEKALTYAACRSAIKFGDPLTVEEQKELCRKLMTLDLPYTCPHGRPTMITLSFEELEKRFKRR